MPFYPLKMLRARERAPIPCFSVVFNLDSNLDPLRSLGVRQNPNIDFVPQHCELVFDNLMTIGDHCVVSDSYHVEMWLLNIIQNT
jgi:hypothetical protein